MLWLLVFPAADLLVQVARGNHSFSSLKYMWRFAMTDSRNVNVIVLAYLALYIFVTAGVLRVTRKSILA